MVRIFRIFFGIFIKQHPEYPDYPVKKKANLTYLAYLP
jgi:hypothetical protein